MSGHSGIHCIGNGGILAYLRGADIVQVFGPPYSAPSVLSLSVEGGIKTAAKREPGTAIWKYSLGGDGGIRGEAVDFCFADIPCFVRAADMTSPVRFTLDSKADETIENTARFPGASGAFLIRTNPGRYILASYPYPRQINTQVLLKGPVSVRRDAGKIEITLLPGKSAILFVGGIDYPECVLNAEKAFASDLQAALAKTRSFWADFTSKRTDFTSVLPDFAGREALLTAIDSVSVLIKCQQSAEGGVIAGYNYHLAYVRDQYGVSRCLLKLGYHSEAKAILSYYLSVWKKFGHISNAQAPGADGVFHIHENDRSEITGYLIVQAFDYYRRTGDDAFMEELFPMLLWAFDAQKSLLAGGMLPFNGDETYIAGGILPRSAINDGSAEATLLFLTGGKQLLNYAAERWLADQARLNELAAALRAAEDKFSGNFIVNGRLIANNPERALRAPPPRFRHGVCEACGCFGWNENNGHGRYVCARCHGKDGLSRVNEKYEIKSVSLVPAYIGADAVGNEVAVKTVGEIAADYLSSGRLPSGREDITVGYDYGLLLYNLAVSGHPGAEKLFRDVLALADDTGAWVEYYENGSPRGTLCRPWESGINLEALIAYAERLKKD